MKKNKKSAGIIYTVKCEITGEFYVGATTHTMHQRKLDHQERAKRGETYPFALAIATYGEDAFIWTQTDTASSIDELARKEKQQIAALNSKEEGLNLDVGGGIRKTIYQYSLEDYSLVNQFASLEDAASAVSANKSSISNACLNVNNAYKGFYWSYDLKEPYIPNKDKRRKKVEQLDDNGNVLATYLSVAEASRQTGMSKTCISRVCRGERIYSGGFLWKYN